ncbi:type II toxin-antitoxin system HicB family antitoxin [Desulfonema magnum]|uniref:Toxin-antitoxin system, antitoxin component, HicB-like n=1 Tax=Desulfonema magnum TaxID=45655 RepID=A0A975GMR1_9BACT|nr:type II toxin-antitoxin system HicB family antitoxin [Desulfonema magnum]QTA86038.1 Toxin-antitoxin system, antitoxin component, HicB-like [Desulfonema magnum]
MMRYLIVLEPTESGFAVQVPDLAIITFGKTVEDARHVAAEAVKINLEAYREAGMAVPEKEPLQKHLENPDFAELLFAFVEVSKSATPIAA